MDYQTPSFLLVDNDKVSVMAVTRMIEQLALLNPVHTSDNGIDALTVLRKVDPKTEHPRPYIVILDVKMPRMGGLEFLEAVRKDPLIRDTPVFMMTDSSAPEDIGRAYRANAAGFIKKNGSAEDFRTAISFLGPYPDANILPSQQIGHDGGR